MDLRTVYEVLAELMFPKLMQIICGSEPARDSQEQRSNQASPNLVARGPTPVGLQSSPKICNRGASDKPNYAD